MGETNDLADEPEALAKALDLFDKGLGLPDLPEQGR